MALANLHPLENSDLANPGIGVMFKTSQLPFLKHRGIPNAVPWANRTFLDRLQPASARLGSASTGYRSLWFPQVLREVALNQQVKDLIQKLGEAIHESVSESDQISGVVREIREQGFDVLLMLEATIGLNEASEEADDSTDGLSDSAVEGPFSQNDLTFLRSLRITTEEGPSLTDGNPQKQLPPPDLNRPDGNQPSA